MQHFEFHIKLLPTEYLQSKNYLVGRKKLFLSQLIFMRHNILYPGIRILKSKTFIHFLFQICLFILPSLNENKYNDYKPGF